eukprot:TRINITY_DN1988_c0_g1_i1.p1 TRINITY_DN1988_c0_g1~~TRINITY_DN1988_c0_g1_i1.p1  ORF type:complete len:501 (+),score=111.44 TRINITY_DN1988_c0_g1_i1:170-1672(+)
MGRRRIEIQPIEEERARQVTLNKRKYGLFKKAYELGILCQCDVALVIYDWKGRHYMFGDKIGDTLTRLANDDALPTDAHTNDTMLKLIEQREVSAKRSRRGDEEDEGNVGLHVDTSLTFSDEQRSAMRSAGSKEVLQQGTHVSGGIPFAKRAHQMATTAPKSHRNHNLKLSIPAPGHIPTGLTPGLQTGGIDLATPTLQPLQTYVANQQGSTNSPSVDMFPGLSTLNLTTGNLPTMNLPTGGLTAALGLSNLGKSPGVLSTPTAGDIHVGEQRLLEARFQQATQQQQTSNPPSRQASIPKTMSSLETTVTVPYADSPDGPDEHVVARTLSNMAQRSVASTTSQPSTTLSSSIIASATLVPPSVTATTTLVPSSVTATTSLVPSSLGPAPHTTAYAHIPASLPQSTATSIPGAQFDLQMPPQSQPPQVTAISQAAADLPHHSNGLPQSSLLQGSAVAVTTAPRTVTFAQHPKEYASTQAAPVQQAPQDANSFSQQGDTLSA